MSDQQFTFEMDVFYRVMVGEIHASVANDEGETPVIALLDHKPLSVLLECLERARGVATVCERWGEDSRA